jgi:hypothetical protein
MEELPVWNSGKVTYRTSNDWSGIGTNQREACKRLRANGVEGRLLPPGHPLCGEYGLFATRKFSRFDVLGEYVGKVVTPDVTGHYVAALEDGSHDQSLGLDAEFTGNEMRFINSHLGVAERPNAVMKTVYINALPHIVIICTEDIAVGEEILFDYGEDYNNAYLRPAPVSRAHTEVTAEDLHFALPFCDTESDNERDDNAT